jgi:hypothetical protein
VSIEFIAQPTVHQIGTIVDAHLRDEQVLSARFLVAWAKNSGLRQIAPALLHARSRGVKIEIIAGVDEGGATLDGLEALLQLTDRAHVFHNPGTPKRTFHPKIYFFEGRVSSSAIVGSGNLTRGGLFGNYEAATLVKAEASADRACDEWRFLEGVRAYIDCLSGDSRATRRLTSALIQDMVNDPGLVIGSERSPQRQGGSPPADPAEPRVFESSKVPLLPIPRVAAQPQSVGVTTRPARTTAGDRSGPGAPKSVIATPTQNSAPVATQPVVGGFYKQLGKFDVSTTSGPGQMIVPIRFESFFGTLQDQGDRTSTVGASQQGRDAIPTRLHINGKTHVCESRIIRYQPGPSHPRQNVDLRFTLHNRDLHKLLKTGDFLEWRWVGDVLEVTRSTSPHAKRYDWL